MPQLPTYDQFLPERLAQHQWESGAPVNGVPGMRVTPSLLENFPDIETDEALAYLRDLFLGTRDQLTQILNQRRRDRRFIDDEGERLAHENHGVPFDSPEYQTVLGREDKDGRVVVGPLNRPGNAKPQIVIPDYLAGDQVTLFGPPDSEKMCINAMNTLHRQLPDEPDIVSDLVTSGAQIPRWGADSEDSKTPLGRDLLSATRNLQGCYDRTLQYDDPHSGKAYRLRPDRLAQPIKRIPGLALPDANHLLNGCALPLHLVELGLHLFHNWRHPEALTFYVPKLENEEEARYLKTLLNAAETLIVSRAPEYVPGTVKVFLVFENPRAIFRIGEMAEALNPYFVGGSLGWHDYLASTARIFRHDPNYRIPVKADPDIVINHIRESHQILVDSLSPIGAIKIGGMYGVLYDEGSVRSFQVCMLGYFRDVITQLKRGLDGFWVAHPSFVRIGLAIVSAWRQGENSGRFDALETLIRALITQEEDAQALIDFAHGQDVPGLERDDPLYQRAVLAADMQQSMVIANDDPEEVRYNVYQALQYIADWLCGNGCVALPAKLLDRDGTPIFVRVMDDLATTERSRWELWAELHHGRVSRADFDEIVDGEVAFIQAGVDSDTKRIQVHWSGEAERWYPIAVKILRQLVLDPAPVEFVSELLYPFVAERIRHAADPWAEVCALAPEKYRTYA